jgi:5,10-methylenetetrahydromethanopterin reductase
VTQRLGFGLLGFPAVREAAELGRAAEATGFESVWVAETRITRDAVTAMTALLLETDRVRVGSAAINVFTRGAALTAITWGSMAEFAPGRVILGIGPGSPTPLAQQGYAFDQPLTRLCEYVVAVRDVWRRPAPIDFDGTFVRYQGLTPEVVPPTPPPVYFCVTGPRALERAGELADGVVLNAFMPPDYVVRARGRLNDGAGGAYEGEIAGALVITIADSVSEAAAKVRPILATYLVFFPDLARETGIDPEFLTRLRAIAAKEGLEGTFAHLPDDVVASHALCGTPAECRERLQDYRDAGLELPILFPDPGSVRPVLEKMV